MTLSDYKTIQTERLCDKIVAQIEQRVLRFELKVGDQLPPERDLAEQMGVSRTAVREAVKALSQKGLVNVQPGRGTFITNGTSDAVRHSLGLMAKIGSPDDWSGLVQVREILEPEIAALAAARASVEHLTAAREAVAVMDDSLKNADRFIEADLDFHLALAEATANPFIPILIDSIVDLLREQRKRIARVEGGLERGQYHHKRILRAVARRDCEAAREAMRAHLRQVRKDAGATRSNFHRPALSALVRA